jgi:hypothetical protein
MLKALGAAGEDIEELGANQRCYSVQGDSFSVAAADSAPKVDVSPPDDAEVIDAEALEGGDAGAARRRRRPVTGPGPGPEVKGSPQSGPAPGVAAKL